MESIAHEQMSVNKKNFCERVWIVQANNKYFNFEKALRDNTLHKWTVTQLNGKWNRSLIDAPKLFKIEIKKKRHNFNLEKYRRKQRKRRIYWNGSCQK